MSVSLRHMRSELLPGLLLAERADEALPIIPTLYPRLRSIVDAGIAHTIGDLSNLPKVFRADRALYETRMVWSGREYPQGWGRGPGGAAAEPPPEPDGKVDVYIQERNANRVALDDEIEKFINLELDFASLIL